MNECCFKDKLNFVSGQVGVTSLFSSLCTWLRSYRLQQKNQKQSGTKTILFLPVFVTCITTYNYPFDMMVNIAPEKIKEIAAELNCGMKCYYHIPSAIIETYPDELKGYAGFDEEPWKEVIKKVKKNQKEYVPFEGPGSHDTYRIMEAFIGGIDNDAIRSYFEEVIHRKKPFGQFNNALQHYTVLREEWFQFKNEQLMQWVLQQLVDYNLKNEY